MAGTIRVDETAPSVVITCDEIGDQDTVGWILQTGTSSTNLGACPPQGACVQSYSYDLSRSLAQSTVTITKSNGYRALVNYNIKCIKQGDASQQSTCLLDVVCRYHLAEGLLA